MHALIVGARQVGKSTLIRKVLKALDRPVFGFETKKEDHLADEEHGSPVYIYVAGQPHERTAENLVGYCKNKHPETYRDTFERFAPLLKNPPQNSVIVLDEIGFMESEAPAFCQAIRELLEGEIPVIAAVKHNVTPFLEEVKNHPRGQCFHITPENREALAEEVLAFMQRQYAQQEGETP